MKCMICQNKDDLIQCKMREGKTQICKSCCDKLQSWERCNTRCIYFREEKSNASIQGDVEITRVNDGHTHLFIQDLFLPNIFSQLYCEVEELEILVFEPNMVELNVKLFIKENKKSYNEEYKKDSWKIKNNGEKYKGKVPIFQVYSGENGKARIINDSFLINGHSYNEALVSSNHFNTWLPFSIEKNDYINTEGMPQFQNDITIGRVVEGSHYGGKNDTVWAEIQIDRLYEFTIILSFNQLPINNENGLLTLPFGISFPFPLVNFRNYRTVIESSLYLREGDSKQIFLFPRKEKKEYLFLTSIEGNEGILEHEGYVPIDYVTCQKDFHYDNYGIFFHKILLSVDEGFKVTVEEQRNPIYLGIYNSMKSIYREKYAPIHLGIINATSELRNVKITCEIEGLSKVYRYTQRIKPNEFKNLTITPVIDWDEAKKISEVSSYNMRVVVKFRGKKIFKASQEVIICPIENFVFSMQDVGGGFKTYFHQFLACYCTPHLHHIDKIIAQASRDTMSISGGLSQNYSKIMNELEVIYNTIAVDMRYVSRSFSFNVLECSSVQRISLPSTTLKLCSGNCIDLTVLLASCFEAIKLEVSIFVVAGHAFLGVKVTGTWIYIESMCLGIKSFSDACQIGMKNFDKYFVSMNQPKMQGVRVVNLPLARKSGVLPIE